MFGLLILCAIQIKADVIASFKFSHPVSKWVYPNSASHHLPLAGVIFMVFTRENTLRINLQSWHFDYHFQDLEFSKKKN